MQQQEEEGKIDATAINPGDLLHTIWTETSGNINIFYNRDGADYDPTTVNFSNDVWMFEFRPSSNCCSWK